MPVSYHVGSCTGHKLCCDEYTPSTQPIAVLLWHHGLGDHQARYAPYFEKLAEAGIAVHAFDAHGHGKSEPETRCLINHFNDLVDDNCLIFDEITKKYEQKLPYFVGGQSMGGLVATHTALCKQEALHGLILTSAAIDVQWNPILRVQASVGNLLAALVPTAQLVPAVRAEDMSQDPEEVQKFKDDPMIFHGNVRARTANEVLKGMRALQCKEKELKLPILAVHGTMDKTTSFQAVKALLEKSGSTDKTLKEIEGGYHELLMGPEKLEVYQTISDWIQAHSQEPKL